MIPINPIFQWRAVGPLCALVALVLAGCASNVELISVARPKLYGDDQVRKTLDEHRQALSAVGTTIQEGMIQEAEGIRQAQQLSLAVSGQNVSPTMTTTTAPANPISPLTLPPAPGGLSGLGLSFQSLLKKATERDQRLMGLQYLYLGDQAVVDEKNRLWLIRFDMSVNHYQEATRLYGYLWGGAPQLARVGVQVEAISPDPAAPVHVYQLMPDISTITAQESFIASQLQNLSGAGAGVTGTTLIQGTGSSQSALEQGLVALQEQPMEFAIYRSERPSSEIPSMENKDKARFGFALGPRRHIEQRSWLNPARWFGNKYDIHYVLEPGPRDLYALVVVPCHVKKLAISTSVLPGVGEIPEVSDLLKFPNFAASHKVPGKGSPDPIDRFTYDLPPDTGCGTVDFSNTSNIEVVSDVSTILTLAPTENFQEFKADKISVNKNGNNEEETVLDNERVEFVSATIPAGDVSLTIKNATNVQSDIGARDSLNANEATKTVTIIRANMSGKGGTIALKKDWNLTATGIKIVGPSSSRQVGDGIIKLKSALDLTTSDFYLHRARMITIAGQDKLPQWKVMMSGKSFTDPFTPLTVRPQTIFPNLTNTLLVTSQKPLTSEAQVWIGQYAVPSTNIALLGRYQMKITVPPNDVLKGQVKEAQGTVVKGTKLTIPGGFQDILVEIKDQKITFELNRQPYSFTVSFTGTGKFQINPANTALIGNESASKGIGDMIAEATLKGLNLSADFEMPIKDQGTDVQLKCSCAFYYSGPFSGNFNGTGDIIVFSPASPSSTNHRDLHFSGAGMFSPINLSPKDFTCKGSNKTNYTATNVSFTPSLRPIPITSIWAIGQDTGGGVPPTNKKDVDLVMVIPGVTSSNNPLVAKVALASGGQALPSLSIDPLFGEPLQNVVVTVNNPSVNLSKAMGVTVGGQAAVIVAKAPDKITFRVPQLPNNLIGPKPTDIVIALPAPQKDQVLINKFTYLPPGQQQKSATTTSTTN